MTLKTHGASRLCCLKLKLEEILNETGEFNVRCMLAKCLDDVELYNEIPLVNIRFDNTLKLERQQGGGKLGDTQKKGYEVRTAVTFEIIVLKCRKDHNTFCHASGISDYIATVMTPENLCIKNVEWTGEAYKTADLGHGELTTIATSYQFTYTKYPD